jgi:transposase
MQTLVEHGCGLDVHQATVVACLLWVRNDGRVQKQLRTFGTTTRQLLQLREWLVAEGCTHVAMESTGVYWKPVYAVLEGSELEIVVANAQQVKKVPGRKTDVKDTYKRRSRFWWTFSIPLAGQFFQKRGFFNSHGMLQQLRILVTNQ